MRAPTRLAAAPVLVLVLVAASCGGSGGSAGLERSSDASTTSTGAPTSTTGVPETTTTTSDLDVRPDPGRTPAEVAATIAAAERAVRDLSVTGDALALAAHRQQVAYRAVVDHPEWEPEVAAALPHQLRPVMAANVAAGRDLRALVGRPRPDLPAWRIVPARPADELRGYYEAGEAEFGVPWEYLAAVNLVETRMGRLRGTSTAGARGPMQFIPSTWAAYGEGDIDSDRDAIRAAARYLAANGGADGRMANALHRYNPSDRYVRAVTAYAEQIVTDERALRGYHHWQVYYWSTAGDVWLQVGYERTTPRPARPEDALGGVRS